MFELFKPRLRIFLGWLLALELCFTLIGNAGAEKPNIPDPPPDQVVV